MLRRIGRPRGERSTTATAKLRGWSTRTPTRRTAPLEAGSALLAKSRVDLIFVLASRADHRFPARGRQGILERTIGTTPGRVVTNGPPRPDERDGFSCGGSLAARGP